MIVVCTECNGSGEAMYYVETVSDENTVTLRQRKGNCRTCNGSGKKLLTNADRIRAMSDEELAKLIAENAYTGACNDFGIPHQGQCCHNCERCDAIIKWLQQPAE